jgi:hypothetical protein
VISGDVYISNTYYYIRGAEKKVGVYIVTPQASTSKPAGQQAPSAASAEQQTPERDREVLTEATETQAPQGSTPSEQHSPKRLSE